MPCNSCILSIAPFGCTPSGSNDIAGRIVLVESMKFKDAQNNPDSAFVSVSHRAFALSIYQPTILFCFGIVQIYSSSDVDSTHAHSSTPVPPSLAPFHGLDPQFSSSHLPKLNRKCNSFVCACCKIWPSDRGKYLKFCWSKDREVELLLKLKDARSAFCGSGRRSNCS